MLVVLVVFGFRSIFLSMNRTDSSINHLGRFRRCWKPGSPSSVRILSRCRYSFTGVYLYHKMDGGAQVVSMQIQIRPDGRPHERPCSSLTTALFLSLSPTCCLLHGHATRWPTDFLLIVRWYRIIERCGRDSID